MSEREEKNLCQKNEQKKRSSKRDEKKKNESLRKNNKQILHAEISFYSSDRLWNDGGFIGMGVRRIVVEKFDRKFLRWVDRIIWFFFFYLNSMDFVIQSLTRNIYLRLGHLLSALLRLNALFFFFSKETFHFFLSPVFVVVERSPTYLTCNKCDEVIY